MWIAGFRYVIASTLTVQCIMSHNNKKSEAKLKEITEMFHDKHKEVIKATHRSISKTKLDDKIPISGLKTEEKEFENVYNGG